MVQPAPGSEPEPVLVRESFFAKPGVIPDGTGGATGSGGPADAKKWKPGDAVKKVVSGVTKVVNGVKTALKPNGGASNPS